MLKKIINFKHKVFKNEMINTSFYTGIGTIIQFISGFVVQKIIAVLLGPSGVALISQFQNFISISTSFSILGIQQGVVKYVSEFRNNDEVKKKILSTAIIIVFSSSIVVGMSIYLFNDRLSTKLFGVNQYNFVLVLFSFTILLFALNQLIIAILNGNGEIKKLVIVNITTSLFALFVTASAAYFFELEGALYALALSQSIIFFISLLFITKSNWFTIKQFTDGVSLEYFWKLTAYSLMGLSAIALVPFVQIAIRNYIITHLSTEAAGIWDGMWKISISYLTIITTTLSIYYLPKLSSLNTAKEIKNELLNGYKIIIPFLLVLLMSVYLLRRQIILILYTDAFLEMNNLFLPQLIGDFFKIVSWLIAYVMLAKAKIIMFIVTQVSFSAITYFLSILLIDYYGLSGVVWAHMLKYILYSFVVFFLIKNYLNKLNG